MKLANLAAAGLLVATLVGGTAVAAGAITTTSSSSTASTCLPANHDDTWPVAVDGTPARDPGVRVWHDATGWHVPRHAQLVARPHLLRRDHHER